MGKSFYNTLVVSTMKVSSHIRLFYIASGIAIVTMVIFGILYLRKNREQVAYSDEVERTYKVLSAVNFCEKVLIEVEGAQRGYLLTKDRAFIDLFGSRIPLVDSSLNHIREIIADNSGQRVYFYQLSKFVTLRKNLLINNLYAPDSAYVQNLRNGNAVMDNCRLYMDKMKGLAESLLQSRLEEKNQYQRLNLVFFKITFVTACVIFIIALAIFFRELGKRLTAQLNLKAKINELSNRKKELEEITFAASHDLQEPMRKVRILTTLVTKKLQNKIPDADMEVVSRINKITEQMHNQLNDLVLYTNLLNPKEAKIPVDLNDIFKNAYNKVLNGADVRFQVFGTLPIVNGSPAQLETMLIHLFENAVKFKDPDRELIISVTHKIKHLQESTFFWVFLNYKKYHEIIIADNGIGFDKQYNEKIFGLFQRLHTQSEYPGKGIGLSVARRVMSNHEGFISSIGEKKVGASFVLYFPIEENDV